MVKYRSACFVTSRCFAGLYKLYRLVCDALSLFKRRDLRIFVNIFHCALINVIKHQECIYGAHHGCVVGIDYRKIESRIHCERKECGVYIFALRKTERNV